MRRARVVLGVSLLGACLASTPVASAANPETSAEAARLFHQGRSLVLAKKYAEACPKLAESLRLEAGIGTRLYLADCYEKNGQRANAWVHFREAARAAAAKHDEREAVALRRGREIEAELTRIVIALPVERRVPGVEVRRDGVVVPLDEMGSAFPIDPGVHTVSASAPGREAWSVSIQVGTLPIATTVNVPLLEPARPTTPTPAAATADDVTTADSSVTSSSTFANVPSTPAASPSGVRIAAISAGALGVAAIAVGGFLGLNAKSTYDRSNDDGHCDARNQCDAVGRDARADASSQAMASTLAFTGGVALLATAVIVFVTSGTGKSTSVAQSRGGQLLFDHRF